MRCQDRVLFHFDTSLMHTNQTNADLSTLCDEQTCAGGSLLAPDLRGGSVTGQQTHGQHSQSYGCTMLHANAQQAPVRRLSALALACSQSQPWTLRCTYAHHNEAPMLQASSMQAPCCTSHKPVSTPAA